MAKVVSLGWVDAMLAPFNSSSPFEYKENKYHIVAIDGIKVSLNDSRHFLVSKKHPRGKETFEALQKGLKILKDKNAFTKAYKDIGFINSEVNHWKVLNPTSK